MEVKYPGSCKRLIISPYSVFEKLNLRAVHRTATHFVE